MTTLSNPSSNTRKNMQNDTHFLNKKLKSEVKK
jgi:hypothetical protein